MGLLVAGIFWSWTQRLEASIAKDFSWRIAVSSLTLESPGGLPHAEFKSKVQMMCFWLADFEGARKQECLMFHNLDFLHAVRLEGMLAIMLLQGPQRPIE